MTLGMTSIREPLTPSGNTPHLSALHDSCQSTEPPMVQWVPRRMKPPIGVQTGYHPLRPVNSPKAASSTVQHLSAHFTDGANRFAIDLEFKCHTAPRAKRTGR